jgi:hypothetical protein
MRVFATSDGSKIKMSCHIKRGLFRLAENDGAILLYYKYKKSYLKQVKYLILYRWANLF